jgi:hypothetical protein
MLINIASYIFTDLFKKINLKFDKHQNNVPCVYVANDYQQKV